jgi:hypothetical protein
MIFAGDPDTCVMKKRETRDKNEKLAKIIRLKRSSGMKKSFFVVEKT